MKKITMSLVLLPILLLAGAPTVTFTDTTVTTTTGTVETAGSGSTEDLGTETDTTTNPSVGDNYTATPQDDTVLYTPNLTEQNDIFGQGGNDVIKPTDKEIEDYYGQYYGEDGDDYIELTWGTWSEAYGGNGNDTIVAYRGPHGVSGQYYYGNNGDDKIYLPETFLDNTSRVYGGNGFDIMIVYGTSSQYEITKSGSRYYLKQLSTNKQMRFKDIEKIIFSTDATPNIIGAEEGETFYFDNSKTLSTTPTTDSNSELTTITLYEHRFSLNTSGASGMNLYINNISDKIYKLIDTVTNTEYEVLGRNITNNDEKVVGQTGYIEFSNPVSGTREFILLGNEQATQSELDAIRTTLFF